jgi:hypothetical protein
LKILKVCSRPKFAQDSETGLRSGRGCSEVFFFEGEHSDIFIKNSDKNKNLTPATPQKVSILKSSPLKNTAIEKNSTGIDWKFDSLSITVEFFDLRIFLQLGELLPANFGR